MDLRTEIAKPEYAALVAARDWHALAAAVSAHQYPVPSGALVTTRTVMARLDVADARTVLSTLKAAANQDELVAEALLQLRSDGLDVTHANAHAMIDALFVDTNLRAAVKGLGTIPYVCTERDVALAALNDDGSLAI